MNIRDDITEYLTKIAESRGISGSDLGPDLALMEGGILDSLSLLDLIQFMECRWGIEIGEDEIILENFGTIASITKYLQQRSDLTIRL